MGDKPTDNYYSFMTQRYRELESVDSIIFVSVRIMLSRHVMLDDKIG